MHHLDNLSLEDFKKFFEAVDEALKRPRHDRIHAITRLGTIIISFTEDWDPFLPATSGFSRVHRNERYPLRKGLRLLDKIAYFCMDRKPRGGRVFITRRGASIFDRDLEAKDTEICTWDWPEGLAFWQRIKGDWK